MNKIFIALCAIYDISFGSRLLLQTSPWSLPTGGSQTLPGVATPVQPLVCNEPCTSSTSCPSTCAQRNGAACVEGVACATAPIEINNPTKAFSMEFNAQGAAAWSVINVNYGPSGMTKELPAININAPQALYQATIRINNQQLNEQVKVTEINCGAGLCVGATFEFINADFGDLKCDEYAGCGADCEVVMHGVPVACDLVSTT